MFTPLPPERYGYTRKFEIRHIDPEDTARGLQTLNFYVHVGVYDDGRIGEVAIKGAKMGELISGSLAILGTMLSIALQHGARLGELVAELRYARFGPAGFTGDPEFVSCSSMFDLVGQYLQSKFNDDGTPRPAARIATGDP